MSDYPIHTKLSDLISDDDELLSPTYNKIKTRVNIGFTSSSARAIVYRDVLDADKDSLDEDKSSQETNEDKLDENRDKLTDKRTSVDENGNQCGNYQAKSRPNQQDNTSQKSNQKPSKSSEQPYGSMSSSKKLGSLFHKGGRSKAQKAGAPPDHDKETVLPHLKSARRPIPEVESSFIEVQEEKRPGRHIKRQSRVESAYRDQPGSLSATSGKRELRSRVSPVRESTAEGSEADLVEERREGKPGGRKEPQEDNVQEEMNCPPDEPNSSYQSSGKSSNPNGDIKSNHQTVNGDSSYSDEVTVVKTIDEDDKSEMITQERQRPGLIRSKSEVSSNTTASERGYSDDEGSEKEQTERNGGSDKAKKKKSSKINGNQDMIGPRATKSSLLRETSNTSSESKKSRRRSSVSSDDSERSYKTGPPLPTDPIPDANSDFKPNEHWKGRKDAQKAVAKMQAAAKQEFAEKYRKFGLPKRAPSFGNPSTIPRPITTTTTDKPTTDKSTSKNILKPEFNLVGAPTDKYLTPLQQKEKTIRDLQGYINKMELTITLQGEEIANFQEEKEEALQFLSAERDIELDEIYQEMKRLEEEKDGAVNQLKQMEKALEEEKDAVAGLQANIAKMEIEEEEREEKHKHNYYHMYQKGQEAQLIEQEEDLVCNAMVNPGNAPNKQLINRLEKTEKQLDKLRETFRQNTYKQAPHLESDSEAQVELLKSAVFYFLTDCQADINLKTMLSMLNYSDVQKKNIIRHLNKKKK